MLGAASESAILLLLETIGKAVKDSQKKSYIKELLDRLRLPLILKEIQSTIDCLIKSKKIAYEIHQGSTEHLLSLYEMICVQRNDSIHPKIGEFNQTKIFLFINSLPANLEVIYRLINWFRNHKV